MGVLAAMFGYLIACFGVPMPRPSEKDLSVPFACADRSCGCMNADDCWDHCCCFTREQKLAWAVAHNVQIPCWVLNERPKPKSCCQQVAATLAKTKAPASCCAKPKPTSVKIVLSIQARKCRGQGTDWLTAGAVMPAPPRIVWTEQSPCIGELPLFNISLLPCELAPPTPPPRLS
jgi:hypothetical protein